MSFILQAFLRFLLYAQCYRLDYKFLEIMAHALKDSLKNVVKESEHEVAQSCLTLYDPIDGSPLGSSVPGILQARILE